MTTPKPPLTVPVPQDTHPHLRAAFGYLLAMMLSAIAGMTDAIGFQETGEFVSFMSGNTTRMGIAVAKLDMTRAERLGLVIVIFVIGNALGAITSRLAGKLHATAILGCTGIFLGLAAGLPAIPGLPDLLGLEGLPGFDQIANMDMTLPSLVLMILAMGGINSAVEEVEGVGLGMTYVTGALSKFGRGLGHYLMGKRDLGWTFQSAPWTGILSGAIIGAALGIRFGRHGLWVPCLLAFSLSVFALLLPREWQRAFV